MTTALAISRLATAIYLYAVIEGLRFSYAIGWDIYLASGGN